MTTVPAQYASPVPTNSAGGKAGKPVAAVMLLLTTIFLIGLSGCFLIGVAIVTNPFQNWGTLAAAPPTMTMGTLILIVVLYTFAIITFTCALWVLSIGVRWLKKVVLE